MTMADRIAVMDKGHIMQVATPAEVYEAPNSKFVADFIGNVSMFEGTVEKSGNGAIEVATKDGFIAKAETSENVASGSNVWFAIRPEKFKVSKKKPENAGVNSAEGEVWDIAYLGDMTVFNVKLASGKVVKISQMNATRETEEPLAWDDKVWVTFPANAGIILKN